MAKYGNLDKIIAKLEEAIEEHKADISEENAITAWIFKRFIAELEKVPAVDVVPVRHGHWIEEYDCGYITPHCSECGETALTKEETMYDYVCSSYCPRCGARMDKLNKCNS